MTQSSSFAFLLAYVRSITHCAVEVYVGILSAGTDNHYHRAN